MKEDISLYAVINAEDFTGYEFDTEEEILNPETDNECSTFRLQHRRTLTGDTFEVYEVSTEDYFVYDEVTHLFSDVPALWKEIQRQIPITSYADYTEGYKEFLEKEKAEEERELAAVNA